MCYFAGNPVLLSDTVHFLANGGDTISVGFQTIFQYLQNPFSFTDSREGVSGQTFLNFGNQYGFTTAKIIIRKRDEGASS